jgi:hypothetical protein
MMRSGTSVKVWPAGLVKVGFEVLAISSSRVRDHSTAR